MKVILNSGFRNPAIGSFISNFKVDSKEIETKNKKYREFAAKYLGKEYKIIKNSVDRLNYQNKKQNIKQVKMPEFDIDKLMKTGELSKELYNLLEYGSPTLGISPKQIMSKLSKLCI